MKNKKLISIFILVFMIIFLVGCEINYNDLEPKLEDLATWDGNYFYSGNIRTKSTGEDLELLVPEIEYMDQMYTVNRASDYLIENSVIHMILTGTNGTSKVFALASYNTTNKQTEIYYIAPDQSYIYYKILDVTSDHLIVILKDSNLYSSIRIDRTTKESKLINDINTYRWIDNYFIVQKNGYFHYTNLNDFTLTSFVVAKNYNYTFNLIEKNNITYIRIHAKQQVASFTYHSELAFYNIENDSLHTVFSMNNRKDLNVVGTNHYVVGETKAYEYVSEIQNTQTKQYEVLTSYLVTKNELYSINFLESDVTSSKVYTFEEDKDFMLGYAKDDKNLIFRARWVIPGNQVLRGSEQWGYYQLNLDNMNLSSINQPTQTSNPEQNVAFIIANGYKYYFEEVRFGPFLSESYAYYLYQENLSTNEVKIIQFFAINNGTITGLRYSEGIWDNSRSLKSDHILVLNY